MSRKGNCLDNAVMETFMDEVEVNSAPGQGTKVRMLKRIRSDAVEMGKDG